MEAFLAIAAAGVAFVAAVAFLQSRGNSKALKDINEGNAAVLARLREVEYRTGVAERPEIGPFVL